MSIRKSVFDPSGGGIAQYTLCGASGMCVDVLEYGAILRSVRVPTGQGYTEVTLGSERLADYQDMPCYLGAVVGRNAGRIANSAIEIDGVPYQLTSNEGSHHLHGGAAGFDRKIWRLLEVADSEEPSVTLACEADDGEQGYPGKIQLTVQYSLSADNELTIEFGARTDRATLLNLTHHAYFNLSGQGDCLDHQLSINADTYLPVNHDLTAKGIKAPVALGAFDFRQAKTIGRDIRVSDDQLLVANGYDHSFCLNRPGFEVPFAWARSPRTGISMQAYTNQPLAHFYSGNSLGGFRLHPDRELDPHAGFCLETQGYPYVGDQSGFPRCLLRPGHDYQHKTRFRFFSPSTRA
ncbi:aldose epimerase family protein [Kordiimonas sp.]|uniref:aldose epimerase family protein n=1 Tax=Kordiimonas sp. TaxID=1970157 RepID=UPI003A8EDA98